MRTFLFSTFFVLSLTLSAQLVSIPIGQKSYGVDSLCSFTLIHREQNYKPDSADNNDVKNKHIDSPKAAIFLNSKNKFYINSLEGCETLVFDMTTLGLRSVISHCFSINDSSLFYEKTIFDYDFQYKGNEKVFCGKPVELCFSHNGKYLWTTYYRRSFDKSAVQPSAVAIVDTETDSIVRVMTTGPLPKMICASPDGKYIAVTHWGDNTVGIIDVSSDKYYDFNYVHHCIVDEQLVLNSKDNTPLNRDSECGLCLRGTVFSPDSKYLLVGRMSGGGIAVFETDSFKYLGTVWGMKTNIRHLLVTDDYIYVSANKPGYVQKAPLDSVLNAVKLDSKNNYKWQEVFVGVGARTIDITPDGQYILVSVNNESKVVMIRTNDMQIVAESKVDSYPVGLSISDNGKYFIVTSQGRSNGGGNSVMIFELEY